MPEKKEIKALGGEVWKKEIKALGDEVWNMNLLPISSTLALTPADRQIGRLVSIDMAARPSTESAADLVSDLFFKMYAGSEYKPTDTLPPSRKINQLILKWAENNEGWRSVADTSTGSIIASSSAASILWENLVSDEVLKTILEEQAKAEEEERKAQQQRHNEFGKALKGEGGEGGEGGEDADNSPGGSGYRNAHDERAEGHMQNAIRALEKLQGSPVTQGMMSDATEKTGKSTDEMMTALRAWGYKEGSIKLEDASRTIRMLQKNRLAHLSKLIGRLKSTSTKAFEGVRQSYTGIVVEAAMTHRIDRVFPTELAYLSAHSNPVLRGQKIHSLVAGGGLLGWRPKSEGKEEGGFIGLVDRSGSMSGHNLDTAKAISLGVSLAAKEDSVAHGEGERYYELTYFDSQVLREYSVNNRRVSGTLTSKDDINTHVNWACINSDGGTNFDNALKFAVERLGIAKSNGLSGIDILFITDGGSYIHDSVADMVKLAKEETHARIIYVQIGGTAATNAILASLSDTVIAVSPYQFSQDSDRLVVQIATEMAKHKLEGYEKGGT